MATPGVAANLQGSLWFPFKELYNVVYTAVFKRDIDVLPDLEAALHKHKPDFIALFRDPLKNAESRELVKRGSTDGIPIMGQQVPQIISQQMIDETFILSDMFNINEICALELLLAGESKLSQFPGLTRGLVAVLLYYDGRRSLVSALRTLIQAREGHTWTLGISNELVNLTTRYTDQLIEDGLMRKILDLLHEIDFAQEIDKLQKNRALGNPRHRKQIVDLILEIKQTLAECLYCWACQTSLSRDQTVQLLHFLVRHNPLTADGSIDNTSLALLMAALYSIDLSYLEQVEDSESFIQRIPLLADPDFVPHIHKELTNHNPWENYGMKALIQFAWAVTLRILSQQPNTQAFAQYFEEDETIIDQAVEGNVFFFMFSSVLTNKTFHHEEFYVKRIHNLITDFIIHIPLKVKELRNRGDETARIILAHRQEGLEPPVNLPRYFEHFLQVIADLYAKDPLLLELMSDYWCPAELSTGFSTMYPYRPPQRQVNLYKFVRLAGDLLPPSLYVSYIRMLTSLSNSKKCAHHCFTLLKLNGSSPGGHCSTVSWDHFFLSLNRYYSNLRQEMPLSSDTQHIYRQRPFIRGITSSELEGLIAVLQLMRMVISQDESDRIAMCDNQQWFPLVVLLGLVGCSVPPALKAELLLTLATFAKTPAIAANLWHSLEVAQILQTVKTTSSYQSSGIQIELDEIEARNEEFPMTLAFLTLINTLIDIPIPPTLGTGFRAPGFDPYFDFIRDSVFLKFNTRAYKNAGEKWDIAAACLSIFYKLLQNHEVSNEDFTHQVVELQGGGSTRANKRPGHNVLIHMLHDSGMLKMVLMIIDEAVRLLDQYTNFPGKESLEQSSLLSLKLISCVLSKQIAFLDKLRELGSPFLVNTMDKLLLGINPRSGSPDHLVRIAKFIMYSSFLPEHALHVIKILTMLCQSPVVQPQLITLFTMDERETRLLLYGFVETLELEENEDSEIDLPDQEDDSQSQIRNITRQDIINLLLVCLPQPAPNLAHYLLGFELRKPVNKTVLQEPGVLGSPRTCLHSIISILLRGIDSRSGPSCIHETPALTELCYHLIYSLCIQRDTSGPILRYLRTTYDFLYRQLQHIPFKFRNSGLSSYSTLLLTQQSWLMKAIAVELRVTSLNRQRSHIQRLVSLLIDVTPDHFSQGFPSSEGELPNMEPSIINSTSQLRPSNIVTGSHGRNKLMSILDSLQFSQSPLDPPQWEYFDSSSVELVISSCEERLSNGLLIVNISKLHKLFQKELNDLQGASALGQRTLITQEIQNILTYVVKRNKLKENTYAKRQAFDAWRQITEIILTAVPSDLIEGEKRQTLLLELTQELLHKVLDPMSIPELSNMVAGVVLTLLTNLRQCFLFTTTSEGQFMTLLESSYPTGNSSSKSLLSSQSLHSSAHQVVLKGLIECIMKSGIGPQRVRANYYSGLLNFLKIPQKQKEIISTNEMHEKHSFESRFLDKELEHEKMIRENMEIILSYGEHFMEVICRDICNGHDVGRMLAMATLDVIISMDRHQHWLSYLTSQGYLRHIVESILQDDITLQNIINLSPESLRTLYVHESKMALLIRISSSISGANNILDSGLMNVLAECKVFDMRPEQDSAEEAQLPPDEGMTLEDAGFLISPMGRYRQILLPTLRLCLAITSSLGKENTNVSTKLLQFVIAHGDVFTSILRERHTILTLPILQELSLVTQVIAKAAVPKYIEDFDAETTAILEVKGQLRKFQRLLLSLLHRYALNEALQQHLVANLPTCFVLNEANLAVLEILATVLNYCHNLMNISSGDRHLYPMLFLPNLMEAISNDMYSTKDFQTKPISTQMPNLGIIIYLLHQCTSLFMTAYDMHKNYTRKIQSLSDLGLEEMKEFLPNLTSMEKMSGHVRKQTVRQCLSSLVNYKAKEVQYYSYMIENMLFIIWQHLEYYLINCSPIESTITSSNRFPVKRYPEFLSRKHDNDNSSSVFGEFGITSEELKKLKLDTQSCLNETIFKKLQEISQVYIRHRSHFSFLEAIVRRLKHIVRLHTK